MAQISDALAFEVRDGRHVVEAPAQWSQGRTIYGGMTAALCHEAAQRQHGPLPLLRSAQFMFAGPATGSLSFGVHLLRAGRSSTAIAVECLAGVAVAARASFAFGSRRDSQVDTPSPLPPDVSAAADCPAFMGRSGGFHDNFELRLAGGAALCSGGPPRFAVWARFRDPQDVDATTALLALADVLPPAAMATFPAPAPISTISWGIDIAHIPDRMNGWHLLTSDSDHSRNGYSMQAMALWDAAGCHLASSRQTVAIFT